MAATPNPTTSDQDNFTLIAPLWHTCVLLLILLSFSVLGVYASRAHVALTQVGVPSSDARVVKYLVSVAFEWLLVLFVWFGIRSGGITLRALIAGRWPTWRVALRDLGVAVVFLVVSYSVIGALGYVLRAHLNMHQNPVLPLLPHGRIELIVFCLVALSAGFCEELVFRGYFLRQFSAITKNKTTGLLLQSVVFGLGHGYQGLARMMIIAVEGCLLGILAHWRRSLRPGMIAHGLQDAIAGIVSFGMTK